MAETIRSFPIPAYPDIGTSREKTETQTVKKTHTGLRNAALTTLGVLMGLDAAGAAATELTDRDSFLRNPEQAWHQQTVDDAMNPLGWIENMQTPDIPPTFDNKADKQMVSLGVNTESVAIDDLPAILNNGAKPLEKGKFADESILFPVKININEPIGVETSYVYGVWNPLENKIDTLPVGKQITIPKAGTEIIVPIKDAEIFKFEVEGKDFTVGIALQYFGVDGTRYVLRIPFKYIGQIELMDSIINAPAINPRDLIDYKPIAQKGKGLSLPPGTPILKTAVDNAVVEFSLSIYSENYEHGTSYTFSFLNNQTNQMLCLPDQE